MDTPAPGAQENLPDELPPAVVAAGRHVTSEMLRRLTVLARAVRMVEREMVAWDGLLFTMSAWATRAVPADSPIQLRLQRTLFEIGSLSRTLRQLRANIRALLFVIGLLSRQVGRGREEDNP